MGLIAPETSGRSHDTETLFRDHSAAVGGLCRSLLRDRSEAEDATQQVFLSAHRALLNGAVPREPLAWLLAVARNECYARGRQRAVAPVLTGDPPDGATADASVHVLRAGDLASVWDEVGQMPPTQREAFLLREIRGLSYGQLAAELSLSPPSVRSLLLRARSRLRQRLRDVAALGGTPWLQGLLRTAGIGDGASPVPAATKAAAVGLGALALVGGGDVPRPAHKAPTAPVAVTVRHHVVTEARHVSARDTPAVVRPRLDRAGAAGTAVKPEQAGRHGETTRDEGAGSGGSTGHDGGKSVSSTDGRGDGSDGSTATAPASQPTTDGRDGGTSGSDGGSTSPTTTTTPTTTTDSGSNDGSGSGGSDGGSSSGGTDGVPSSGD
jgi:RNA polymerase sigma factor (sigma-70 family)